MSDDRSRDELRAAYERDLALTRALEKELDRLDGRNAPWSHVAGVELPRAAAYNGDDERYRADHAADRLAYLEGRYRELSDRAAHRAQAAAARNAGIDRFAGAGRFSLDEILAATLATPGARQELEQQHADARVARIHAGRVTEQQRLADTIGNRGDAA